MNEMENNYNREALLHQALIEHEMDMQDLEVRLGMSEEEIISGLSGPEQVRIIAKVCEVIDVDPSFFWGNWQ